MNDQRGFSLAEVLVCSAIAALLALGLAGMSRAFVGWTARATAQAGAYASLDRLEDRIDAESAGAWSVFVPARDVLGADNTDGHEFDIATRDAARRASFRAYRYDAVAREIGEYVYAAPGEAAVATGDVTSDVTEFGARVVAPSGLDDPLYANAVVAEADVPLDFGIAAATGGNALALVSMRAGTLRRDLTIASGTAPSGVTVVLRYTPAP